MLFSLCKYFQIAKIHILFITIIIILTKSHICSLTKPSFLLKTNFPVYEDENIDIEFYATHEKIPLYSFIMFRCRKIEILEEHVLSPGHIKGLHKRLYGDYFIILKYTVLPYKIIVTVQFKRTANYATFEVMFLETDSKELRSSVIHEPENHSQHSIGSFNISLFLHWKFELIQRTLDHREGAFIVNSSSLLICRAIGGFPFSPVKFIGIEELSKASLETSKTANEVHLTFQSKINDHLKKVGCQAGDDVFYDTIHIFHHSTKLKFVPHINGYIRNGTHVRCIAIDGYPIPKVQWVWVAGPNSSQHYFSIINDNVLYIGKNAPIGSEWMFECISKNTIPNSLNSGKLETVSFIIGDRPVPYVLIISILLGIVFLIILVVITVYCCRGHSFCCRKKPSSKSSSVNWSNQNVDDRDSLNKTLLRLNTYVPYLVDEV